MFKPKTDKIEKIAKLHPKIIKELEKIFDKPSVIYLDYSNLFHWHKKLGWHINQKRLKQFLDSFKNIKSVGIYNGTLIGDKNSEQFVKESRQYGYKVVTKPVKIMRLSVDVSGIAPDSPAIVNNFVDKALTRLLDIQTIEFLNEKFKELNDRGMKHIEKRKCNFDVEIGVDMLLDHEKNHLDNFIIWTGDSDFAGPIHKLMTDGKNVFIFATARRLSHELAETKAKIFDIKKIKEFICWNEEISENVKKSL